MFEFIESREFLGQLSGCQVFKYGFYRECFLIGWLPSAHVWSVVGKAKSDILKHMRRNAEFSVRPIGSCNKYSIFTTQWLLFTLWRSGDQFSVKRLCLNQDADEMLVGTSWPNWSSDTESMLVLPNEHHSPWTKKGNGEENRWKRIINSVGVTQSCKACTLERERYLI
jgi:hypothetical protein